jgi:hypothetical protein
VLLKSSEGDFFDDHFEDILALVQLEIVSSMN